jgi:O-antigen/teichoic acid export membrane protein
MIRCLGQEQFGVWSTLLTIMTWIFLFDLGIGNGLRNKVTEALAKGKIIDAKKYISAGYTLIGIVMFFLWIFFTIGSFFISWQIIFNTSAIEESTLRFTFQIVVFFVLFNFWLNIVSVLLSAIQKTSIIALGQMISNVISLLLILILPIYIDLSINNIAFVYGFSIVFSSIVNSLWFYRKHKDLMPCFYINTEIMSPLLSLGIQFFIIQVAVVIIFTTDKIMITQLFGPKYVTQYEIIFKLFSVITIIHTLISAPLWTAYTDAFQRDDVKWIKLMIRKQITIFIGIVVSAIVLSIFAGSIIKLWIGNDFVVSDSLIVVMAIFVIIYTWNGVYAMFINGVGDIKIQLYISIIAMVINIPLTILLTKYYGFGLNGVVLSNIISLMFAAVILPIQVRRIINKKENRIKNKSNSWC